MKKINCLVILLLQFLFSLAQKEKDLFNEGYVLKGKDTINCKILFQKDEDLANSITVSFNDDLQVKYKPLTDNITAFGFIQKGVAYDYSILSVLLPKETKKNRHYLFARKLVEGSITIYRATYKMVKFTRNKTTGENKSYEREIFTDYLIQKKNDSSDLFIPTEITSFKKKDLAGYFLDHSEICNKMSKNLSLKELIVLATEYNSWYIGKKKDSIK